VDRKKPSAASRGVRCPRVRGGVSPPVQ
jgi:hypothetical protein